jgi:hypothetical protein
MNHTLPLSSPFLCPQLDEYFDQWYCLYCPSQPIAKKHKGQGECPLGHYSKLDTSPVQWLIKHPCRKCQSWLDCEH